ncbi:inactive caspase-12-like isoform X2 [Notamacropus eugenii]|uniref:inactive caspase-12-like isoform X2 n=1 Tax=Notamacropus eugenii TaxID=9315 RepID=UPI003B677BB5
MDAKNQTYYVVKTVKCLVSTFVDGVIDDLIEKDVLSPNEMKNLGKEFTTIVHQSDCLVNTLDQIIQGSKIIMKKLLLPSLQGNSGNQREDKALALFQKSEAMDQILSVLQIICNSPGSFQSYRKRLSSTILQFFKKLDSNAVKATGPPNQVKLCKPDFYLALKEAKEGEEMESVLKEFADRPEHWCSDSAFLVFMSHGLLNGICGKAHSKQEPDLLATDTIFQIFNDGSCPSLKGKPKIIIIQACRGEKLGMTYVMDASEALADVPKQPLQNFSSSNSPEQELMEKDFISFCSTTPHNVSWRYDALGSVFINELIYCFQLYAWCCHLEEVFRKVQKSFEIPKTLPQMPTIERVSMSRYFYLFPGI